MKVVKCVLILMVLMSSVVSLQAAVIKGVSIPVNSHDAGSYPRDSGVWSVSAPPYPLDTSTGIGYILNPSVATSFSMHDHVYVGGNVPDPTRAVVTYEFNQEVAVDQLEVMQHRNGITRGRALSATHWRL